MAKRKPKIVYYWTVDTKRARIAGIWTNVHDRKVNWRLVGANGEIMCQSTQGFRDKTDAVRSVDAVRSLFYADIRSGAEVVIREIGPGRKPA